MTHPLQSTIDLAWEARASLSPGNSPEIRAAVEVIRGDPRFESGSVFAHVRLYEPTKDAAAEAVEREIEALLVPPDARLEAI